MKRYINILLLLVMVLFQTQVHAANVSWRKYSEQVFTDAKEAKKPILIYGKASWCPYCQKMNGTFANPQISSLVNKNFIPVMIDVDESPDVATEYGIMTLPAIVILDGRAVKKTIIGYNDAADFGEKLRSYLHL